jgi:hypothetical protein
MGVSNAASGALGHWQAHGERLIYESPWVWLGQVDVEPPGGARYWHHVVRLPKAEHHVFVGRGPRRVGEPTDPAEAARVEWVPLASVPALIAAGDIWNAGSLTALPLLLVNHE